MTSTPCSFANDTQAWFRDSLQCLRHEDPSLIATALLQSTSTEEEADTAFRQISLWLEDRIIRQWDVKARAGLRNDFWLSLVDYLNELDCPSEYYAAADWRRDARRRTRVMYWLIACAISEVHEDKCCSQQEATTGDASSSSAKSLSSTSNNTDSFPLGFTTNDPQVDQALTYIRMQHLMQLRQEQDQINSCIAQLQATSVAKSKPLKARKQR